VLGFIDAYDGGALRVYRYDRCGQQLAENLAVAEGLFGKFLW
jgi:hypothetical protein